MAVLFGLVFYQKKLLTVNLDRMPILLSTKSFLTLPIQRMIPCSYRTLVSLQPCESRRSTRLDCINAVLHLAYDMCRLVSPPNHNADKIRIHTLF